MTRRSYSPPINEATFLQHYRNNTAKMLTLNTVKKQVCPCCKVARNITQFDEGKAACKNCRRPR